MVFVYTQLNVKRVLFQAIQFSLSTPFSCIWLIDRILSGAINPGQSGPGGDGNEGVLWIPQCSSITEASPSDCIVSHLGHPLRGILFLYRDAFDVLYSPNRLANQNCIIPSRLVSFYGISTLVGYLMPNPVYTYTLNILYLVWLAFMTYQPL